MEAFAVISIVSSIVQLVDFGASCLSSGLQLYRSTDGVSDEHEAIGIATQHLAVLNTGHIPIRPFKISAIRLPLRRLSYLAR
jgi:hypothetical protein